MAGGSSPTLHLETMTSIALSEMCLCGCGQQVLPDKRNRRRFWLKGHHRRKPNSTRFALGGTGRQCSECGAEIQARQYELNWARRHRAFCSKKCANTHHSQIIDIKKVVERLHTPTAIGKAVESRMLLPHFQPTPNHLSAKYWWVRDPNGQLHKFKNLSYWIKTNPHLFAQDDILKRAYAGIQSLRPTNRTPVASWKGWTWHSQLERLHNNGEDLLDR